MKKVLLLPSMLLIIMLALICDSCNSGDTKTVASLKKTVTKSDKKIMDEPLVHQALIQLPEAGNLDISAVMIDSVEYELTILFSDKKTDNVDVIFTTHFGEEVLFLTRKYPCDETLELAFSFKKGIFSVEGSRICSPTDTITLDEIDVYRITSDGYKLRGTKNDKQPLIRA